jgi:hypothetical protein
MGVLNVTPDSFSDGGDFIAPDQALARARAMIEAGVDIIDIGAESTRPYGDAQPIPADEELARLRPVLPDIIKLGVPVSIDSMKSSVVAWALDAGAVIANDIWGLQRDSGMATLVAERACRRDFDLILFGSGDGELVRALARAVKRIQPWTLVGTLSVEGATSFQIRCANAVGLIDWNSFVGQDLVRVSAPEVAA